MTDEKEREANLVIVANAMTGSDATFYVARTCDTAKVPTRGSVDSAGWDLSASKATVVPARGKALVKTGLKIALPAGTYGRIAPRSGLAWKKHIDVGAGVIDRDYRGEVSVVLFNHAGEDLAVAVGDRVAQLVLERISMVDVVEVPEAALEATARGGGGFGSTGTHAVYDQYRPSLVHLNAGDERVNCPEKRS